MPTLLFAALLIGQVSVSIEAKRLNPSEKMPVRFLIENMGEGSIDVEEPSDWAAGLEIRDANDKVVKDFGAAAAKRTVRLEGRAFMGRTVDIAPALAGKSFDEGVFKITWRHAGATSPGIEVPVVRDYLVKMTTNFGDVTWELYPDTAPKNVMHFISLVREGFYDNKTFYMVIPSCFIQGGNPKADGSGKSSRAVKGEFTKDRKVVFGTVGLARMPKEPDSATTDFFIALGPLAAMEGKFSIIGQVIETEGGAVVREIAQVKTDHNPCKGCGEALKAEWTPHCGQHHTDRPEIDVIIKKVTLSERKN